MTVSMLPLPDSLAIIIVAAGSGTRLGREQPKQYQMLGDKAVLRHSVDRFRAFFPDAPMIAVINPDHHMLLEQCSLPDNVQAVHGGATRQASVKCGLEALDTKTNYVFIHDAARPFITQKVCTGLLNALTHHHAAIPTLPVTDTIKQVQNTLVSHTIDRSTLRRIQTPQAFHYSTLLACHQQYADDNVTDDAALCEKHGIDVVVIDGDEQLFKITTQDDLLRATLYL